jgi:hypothetical protein
MSTKQKKARLEKLGVANFESLSETRRLQKDLNQRLQRAAVAPSEYEGLGECTTTFCGRDHCCDACWFGWRKRRLDLIPMVHDLFAVATGPIYEIRVARGHWVQPHGHLHKVSIGAVTKWNRWALDKLYDPDVMAVGMVKVAPAVAGYGDVWVCEIHEVVASVSKVDLERVLGGGRTSTAFQNHLDVSLVHNLGDAVGGVLRQDLCHWDTPGTGNSMSSPAKALRRELYSWQLGLDVEERIIRYGCDGDFRKMSKPARVPKPRPRKPHPDPVWLKPYQFGSDTREAMDRQKAARFRL